jgi:hypothetical protein
MRFTTIGLALTVGLFANAVAAQVPQKLPPSVTVDTQAFVTVQNHRKVPVWLYLEHGRFDHRLGKVPANDTLSMPLPASVVHGQATVRLFVHPEGEAADLSSELFTLPRAARLTLVVPSWSEMQAPADTMSAVIPPDVLDDASVTVDNPRNRPVTVFIRHGKFDTRIGVVPAVSRATLRFPTWVVDYDRSITIFAQPLGGPDLATERMKVAKGQHVGLRIPPR